MADVVIVGAADTGRAPIAAALLRRLLITQGIDGAVASAGILGHDGDPASGEALAAADQIGIDLATHQARSISDAIANDARLLIAIDSGIARVLSARMPHVAAKLTTLGELAGKPRNIPDPFKMQLGAWLTYLREIDELLAAALPQIRARLGGMSLQEAENRGTEEQRNREQRNRGT
ncbi:MAG TPA: protein tyrosine phosphatase, partial [Roseiflexaceae bacterium]|nr:protein tyrosine phosphatase [Roseiflexaceae bacterium]